MRIKIRIYNPYDLDIIALSEAPNFSVANAMKQTLKYYAAGKRYLVEIPTLTEELKNDNYAKGFYVELNDETDAQAVAFIKSIPDGYRNAFMKNIFRASFEVSPLSLYMGEGGADYVAKMIENPRYGRYPVQREIVDSVFLAEGEVGVTISDAQPDIAKLTKNVANSEKPKKAAAKKDKNETLRDLTQSAYRNAAHKKEEQKAKSMDVLAKATSNKTGSDDLDDLLDSMM
jgi:hypothetical protein